VINITDRQSELLKLIIEEYIKTAKPIGSKGICELLNCSSATIRNDMSELENLGYLEKTHTSSGRMPSGDGYRYYVDKLMKPDDITGSDMLKLQTVFKNQDLELNDVIKKSLSIISEITNYTSVVLGSHSNQNKLQKIEVLPIEENKILVLLITDKGYVENKHITLEEHINPIEISKTVDLINKMLVGIYIDEMASKLEFEIKPIISEYIKQYEAIYNAFYNAFNDLNKRHTKQLLGTGGLINNPEFDDVSKIRNLIDKFEDDELIESITENNEGINIYIGKDNHIDDDVTVIKMPYTVNGEKGTIAIVGPKRMEYNRVIKLLEYLKENIERWRKLKKKKRLKNLK